MQLKNYKKNEKWTILIFKFYRFYKRKPGTLK